MMVQFFWTTICHPQGVSGFRGLGFVGLGFRVSWVPVLIYGSGLKVRISGRDSGFRVQGCHQAGIQ